MKDFQPISLVNSLYKILAKVLANRFKRVISSVIGDTQMTFVKDRQILDSFVVAEELSHHWKRNNDGGVMVKLDFEKAYYSLDLSFLDNMLQDMGFGEKWRQWIGSCVSTHVLSILVNISPTRHMS
ncbi:hypothetical protein Ddye_011271 [Dipteronia dyeriana]|uniref:Reverse transcriptase domain-containing protein n=1 Tax=Dipteronia dyeriana TaxID=168575 RepID=A0AAE0CGN3_9ROSI|nr:hypothetical protein Ddye_011271 [Dipteronia dyeriana]